jgi:hypothetical protein
MISFIQIFFENHQTSFIKTSLNNFMNLKDINFYIHFLEQLELVSFIIFLPEL